MKKLLLTLAVASVMSLTAFGQGQIRLDTSINASGSTGFVMINPGSGAVAMTSDFNIELLGGASADTLTQQAIFTGAATSGMNNGDGTFWFGPNVVTSLPYSTTGFFEVRAWTGNFASYAAANVVGSGSFVGTSPVFQQTVSASSTAFASQLTAMPTFTLAAPAAVPEPTTIALGVMGLSALLFRRRK